MSSVVSAALCFYCFPILALPPSLSSCLPPSLLASYLLAAIDEPSAGLHEKDDGRKRVENPKLARGLGGLEGRVGRRDVSVKLRSTDGWGEGANGDAQLLPPLPYPFSPSLPLQLILDTPINVKTSNLLRHTPYLISYMPRFHPLQSLSPSTATHTTLPPPNTIPPQADAFAKRSY